MLFLCCYTSVTESCEKIILGLGCNDFILWLSLWKNFPFQTEFSEKQNHRFVLRRLAKLFLTSRSIADSNYCFCYFSVYFTASDSEMF